MSDSAAPPEETGSLGAALWHAVLADPGRLPERLALFAVRAESGRAAELAARVRRARPDAGPAEPRREVVARGTRTTVLEGSVVGGPFLALIPVAFCAALLVQIRMVLALAALDGHDPARPERARELLVLQGAYASEREAAAALADVDSGPAGGSRIGAVKRLAHLLGVIGGGPEQTSRVREIAGWIGMGLVVLIGVVLPLIWVPAMGIAYQRATTRLGQQATDRYHPGPRITLAGPGRLRPANALIAARTLIGALLPAVALLLVFAADLRLGGSRWAATLAAAVAASLMGAVAVVVRRRRRR